MSERPGMRWYDGQWRTEESIARRKAHKREWRKSPAGRASTRSSVARRIQIRVGAGQRLYLGTAPTLEAALLLRKKIREEAPRGHW